MKTFIAFLSLIMLSTSVHAQTLEMESATANPLNFSECLGDHRDILNRYANQLNTEVLRMVTGINREKAAGAPASKIKRLKQLAGRLIIKEYLIRETAKQTSDALANKQLMSSPASAYIARDILNTDHIKLNIDKSSHKKNPAIYILSVYKEEIKSEIVLDLGEEIFRSIGNGMVMKIATGAITAEAIEGAILSFGSGVLKGAGISAGLTLLASPLMGARKLPEDIWLDMLKKRPELIVNPEWMNEAGSPDAPWFAHCSALKRKAERIYESVSTLISREEVSFLNAVKNIESGYRPATVRKTIQADNTFVYVPKRIEQEVPFWALIRP